METPARRARVEVTTFNSCSRSSQAEAAIWVALLFSTSARVGLEWMVSFFINLGRRAKVIIVELTVVMNQKRIIKASARPGLGHPSAPAPSTLSHASNLDWQFVS